MGETNLIEKANDFYQTDRRSMAHNRGWLPPSGDASRGHFPSVTMNKEPGSRANEAQDTVTPCSPAEIVGKFQILVKLNSMNTNTSVSIARIL
jgi:hypothetical protein